MPKNFLIFLIIVSTLLFAKEVKAGTGENISGFAWSENIGWISFNSTNTGGPVNYGVNVDLSTGNFSGYAWSEHIGWITFNSSELTGCPTGTCEARLNLASNEVSGWARAYRAIAPEGQTLGGWDGWIKLRGTGYGVWLDTSPLPPNPDEFRDWAWSDNVIGWISFNCLNQGVCATSNYKVFISGPVNFPPSATSLNVTQGNYCFSPSPPVFLNWTFSDPDPGDSQTAKQVQIDDESTFTSPYVDDSGKITGIAGSSPEYAPPPGKLTWNATYYWRVMIWDSQDAASPFSVGPSFTTSSRPPWSDFTWAPPSPSAGEVVQFTDLTTFYGTGPSWAWDFDNNGVTDSALQNPTHSYSTSGPYTVKLTATDSNGSCSALKSLTASLPLPQWREVAPTSFLEKFLASILEFLKSLG